MMVDSLTGEVITPFLRSAYNYDTNAASVASGLLCTEPTKAQQQFKEECDINTIVERFGLTGELPTGVRMPMNAEFAEVMDYQTAMNRLIEADAAFMEFPAKIRERFDNDPQKLLDFCNDPANIEEARRLGLALAAPGVLEKPSETAPAGAGTGGT